MPKQPDQGPRKTHKHVPFFRKLWSVLILLNNIRSWVRALGGPFVACLALLAPAHAAHLPCYDHLVIVVEENKDYEEIIGNKDAPFLNRLAEEGASLTNMFAEEHPSEGNYFWLFAGS